MQKKYLLNVGYKTWLYFKENLTEKDHFLPPDNYQEDRKPKLVMRTSSTNIGLALLAVMASYDLKYEDFNDTINLLYNMINTISNLTKWNGHLYNWYNIETLEPLNPRYVSSVDSGNFVGYLYVLKQFLNNKKEKIQESKNNTVTNGIYQNLQSENANNKHENCNSNDIINKIDFNLIILDVTLSDGNGFDFYKENLNLKEEMLDLFFLLNNAFKSKPIPFTSFSY